MFELLQSMSIAMFSETPLPLISGLHQLRTQSRLFWKLSTALTDTNIRKSIVLDVETAVLVAETTVSDAETAVSDTKTVVSAYETPVSDAEWVRKRMGTRMTQRRNFSNNFKAAVALEALRGDKTVQEIAAKRQLHPTQMMTCPPKSPAL